MLNTIKDKLKRRLTVNLLSRLECSEITKEWIDGYEQAIQDSYKFLDQLEIYEPYNK